MESWLVAGESAACGEGYPWVCEHRHPQLANMTHFRQATAGAPAQGWQNFADGDVIAFSRGSIGFLALNRAESPFHGEMEIQLQPGQYRDLIGGSVVLVKPGGQVHIDLRPLGALALLLEVGARHSG